MKRRLIVSFILFLLAIVPLPMQQTRVEDTGAHAWRNPSLFDLIGDGLVARLSGSWRASVVKSLQQGTITIGSGSTSTTATITSVVTANAVAYWLGQTDADSSNAQQQLSTITLTNATTVTAARQASAVNLPVVAYVVVEYYPTILVSNQDCSITIAAGTVTNTATISSVTTAKTQLVFRGRQIDTNLTDPFTEVNLVLTNATTVTAARVAGATTGTLVVGCSAVQFR